MKEDQLIAVTIRIDSDVNDQLLQVAEQTNFTRANLHRLALDNLLKSVKQTGKVPVPEVEVKLESRKEGV